MLAPRLVGYYGACRVARFQVRTFVVSGGVSERYKHLYKNLRLDSVPDLPVQETVPLVWQQYKPSKGFEIDNSLPPVLMLHGLFGSKQNYGSVGRKITQLTGHPIYGVDLRNHGQSPHSNPHNYYTLAKDVIRFIDERGWKEIVLVGHSMGAVTSMLVSLLKPGLISKLIVIDNSPVTKELSPNFTYDLVGMCQVEHQASEWNNKPPAFRAKKIDTILGLYEKDEKVRFFLKTNVIKSKATEHPIFRVPVLNFLKDGVLNNLGAWPADKVEGRKFDKPVLVMGAKHSKFVLPEYLPEFKKYFSNLSYQEFDCGHWIVTDMPEEFVKSSINFINS
ncbi:Alpha/Beta hydrolase protein [Scheffersomyces xylosifermentans]|uniref:Alpha/Beta hydrolase protein n=1 Tax=Scheffersomyces xylosifermentans TaxID=1304137 RepID=UPI00315D0EB4